MRLRSLALAALFFPTPLFADVPKVAVDIPAVQSLVMQVMGDLGTPSAFMSPKASPHGYALRPSEAAILAEANLVIWSGSALVPQIPDMLASLAPNAQNLELMHNGATRALPLRNFEDFTDSHDHGHDHGHDTLMDPHAWLDPDNGVVWLNLIADALGKANPENAVIYTQNARAAQARLRNVEKALQTRMASVRGKAFATSHDAFQYFETHFGLRTVATISLANGGQPGARQLADIRNVLEQSGATCILADTRESTVLLGALAQSDTVKTAAVDPVGGDIAPGSDLYTTLLGSIADALVDCLSD